MGHRGGRNKGQQPRPNKQPCGRFNQMFWQTDAYNNRLYNYYRNLIMQIAMNRFRWVNLPKTCNARFLEWTLLNEGVATIAFPKAMRGTFYTTQAKLKGIPNVYDDYPEWESFGNNSWSFSCSDENGVLVWDNSTRTPIMDGIDLYAMELVHVRRTKQMNRFHQQVPFVLTGPQNKQSDMSNIIKQVAGGELAILATNGLSDIEVNALQTGVPYIGEELASDESQVWNRIYTMLGIDNNSFKAERQTTDEIRSLKEPTTFVRMASLSERRRACDELNDRFENYLTDGPLRCEWNQDNESENFNLLRNINDQAELFS
mgnify:CR=1 FL=1